jgi:peptide deformylase
MECLYKGEELKARCFCHEIDHLDGILYKDNLLEGTMLQRVGEIEEVE